MIQKNTPIAKIERNENKIHPSLITLTQNGAEITLPTSDTLHTLPQTSTGDEIPTSVFAMTTGNQLLLSFYPQSPLDNGVLRNPLVATIPLSNTPNGIVLSINHSDIFALNQLSPNIPYALNKVFLSTKHDNTISVFDATKQTAIPVDFTQLPPSLYPCDTKKSSEVFGINIEPLGNGFSLFGKNTAVCGIIPFTKLLPTLTPQIATGLLQAHFSYTGGFLANICVARLSDGACLNTTTKLIDLSNQNSLQNLLSYDLSQANPANLGLKVFYDTTHTIQRSKTLLDQASYANVTASLTQSLSQTIITPHDLESVLPSSPPANVQKITIPYSGDSLDTTTVTELPKTDGLCENGFFDDVRNNKEAKNDASGDYIRYTSHQGSLCDHFSYQTLPQDQGYLIAVTARNISGLPIRFCVTNYFSKRCDIYAQLSTNKQFTTDIFLLPPMVTSNTPEKTPPQGFDININNFGINRETSVNDLMSIRVLPFPYNWFTRLSSGIPPSTTPSQRKDTGIKARRHNQTLYSASLDAPSTSDTVLALSQAYNTGWRAYSVPNINPLTLLVPFVFGRPLPHVIVNDWENGWTIGSETTQVVMVYLPQYLEYFGLLMLFATILGFWQLAKRRFRG